MKVKILGWRSSSFKGSNGEEISGRNYYYVEWDPIDSRYGGGYACGRLFLSDSRIARFSAPEVGKSYEMVYNRFGKIDSWKEVQ